MPAVVSGHYKTEKGSEAVRRSLLAVLMILLLPLSACGGGETKLLQVPMRFRTALLQKEGCSFQAQMQVRFADCAYDVTLDCRVKEDGSAELTVLAPETIEGIRALLDGERGSLEYEGVALEFGLPKDAEFSPLALPMLLAKAWREAYILSAGQEDGLVLVSYEEDRDGFTVDTWFDESGSPVFAEICLHDRIIAEITLTDVSLNGGEP